MKHTIHLVVAFFMLSSMVSCKQNKTANIAIEAIDRESANAINPYFTKDQKGNVVLCWTSQDPIDSLYRLKYAIYNTINKAFNEAVIVPSSAGLTTSPESMGKVAFKEDGTVIAVFGKKIENAESPYAGIVCYSTSTDHGRNWSSEKIIHSDTSQNVGHSFFDIATLKNGEVAAIWLDGRFGKAEKGSALYFAKTKNGKEFGMDTLLDKNTCECCRTEILADDNGNIHIAYRGIAFPSGMFGKQVRDMVYLSSSDYGNTFSKAKTISNDNWQIEGCPHTGPSLAVDNQQVNAVWFTAGGETGLYYTSSANMNSDFKKRTLLSATGKHPQMTTLIKGKLAIVFENTSHPSMKVEHSTMKMDHSTMNHSSTGETSIILQILKNGDKATTIEVTDGKQADHHAVITSLNKSLLIAWIHEKDGKAQINYSNVSDL